MDFELARERRLRNRLRALNEALDISAKNNVSELVINLIRDDIKEVETALEPYNDARRMLDTMYDKLGAAP